MPSCVAPLRILLIDNQDSYTYNLSHLLAAANANVPPTVVPADAYPSLPALLAAEGLFDAYVVSPGPGTPHSPDDLTAVAAAALADPAIPALGVCLGHQALCAAAGAVVVRAPAGPVHGRLSRAVPVADATCPLLAGLPADGVDVVRYHSLVVDPATLPSSLVPTAWCVDRTSDGREVPVLMAVRHAFHPLYGVQFHPESVLTDCGKCIAHNFVRVAHEYRERYLAKYVDSPVAAPKRRKECDGEGTAMSFSQDSTMALSVRHRRLPCTMADSSAVFSTLYGDKDTAFWLDSSSSATSASLSRCSSVELQPTREPRGQSPPPQTRPADLRGRFSLMGDLSGPRAELVTYNVSERCVRVRAGNAALKSSTERDRQSCEFRDTSIFDYLEEQLARRRVIPPKRKYRSRSWSHSGSDECDECLPIEMSGGYVGYMGYEVKADTHAESGVHNAHTSHLPDAWFVFADRVVVYDHSDRSLYLVAVVDTNCPDDDSEADQWFSRTEQSLAASLDDAQNGPQYLFPQHHSGIHPECNNPMQKTSAAGSPLRFFLERGRASYEADVARCLEYIAAGDSYEICLTNRLRCELPKRDDECDVLSIYQALRLVNPAPYSAFLRLGKNTAICCSSPERFLRASSDGVVESKPIKGTRPRGLSVAQDETLANDLRGSEKDRSENLMIVDLVRNDLGRTCAFGSVSVPSLMRVETYASVHQLVSTVRGRRRENMSMVATVREAYPMGSMTGAPKVRTMNLIDELEASARGAYSGSIGYLSLCGAADLNVVIRTAVVDGSAVEVGVGGAVVALSTPKEEYEEILVKGRPIMQAIALVATGSNVHTVDEGRQE